MPSASSSDLLQSHQQGLGWRTAETENVAGGKGVADDNIAVEVVAAKAAPRSADDGQAKLLVGRPSGIIGAIGFGGYRIPGGFSEAGTIGGNGRRNSARRIAELVAG